MAAAGKQAALGRRWPAVTPRNGFPGYVQVFSALIVIIAGAFVITIIYRSALSFSEPHLRARGDRNRVLCGREAPRLAAVWATRRAVFGHEPARVRAFLPSTLRADASGTEGHVPAWLLASQPHGQRVPVCRPPGPTLGLRRLRGRLVLRPVSRCVLVVRTRPPGPAAATGPQAGPDCSLHAGPGPLSREWKPVRLVEPLHPTARKKHVPPPSAAGWHLCGLAWP